MRVVAPRVDIEPLNVIDAMRKIERLGRVSYRSEDAIRPGSYAAFIRRLVEQGHESVLEHASISAIFTVDRGVSHELVRHRIASYTQESTRYCNYSDGVTFIEPFELKRNPQAYQIWHNACEAEETAYCALLAMGYSTQWARSVLGNSLKTEVAVTANLREWRHILKLRTAKTAHPQIRQVMIPLLALFKDRMPPMFVDMEVPEDMPMACWAKIYSDGEQVPLLI